ncbi:MAG: hypothetical protein HY527_06905 [Betaproteobacteria bacterium]|nr:hypothetical protein [Betaproteobacteria bacterium]
MAEIMTVESIVEADWQMQGFWTKVRYPLRTKNGSWSDIDILAYKPESRELVIAESKVRGPKKAVYAYTKASQQRYGTILEYDIHGNDQLYFGFLEHIKLACEGRAIFDGFSRMVSKLIVQLVSNYVIDDDVKPNAIAAVKKQIRKDVPKTIDLDIRLESTLDVIARIIKNENVSLQGRRYGHPVIDIARELNRYMHPDVHYAGRTRGAADIVRASLKKRLMDVLEETKT